MRSVYYESLFRPRNKSMMKVQLCEILILCQIFPRSCLIDQGHFHSISFNMFSSVECLCVCMCIIYVSIMHM